MNWVGALSWRCIWEKTTGAFPPDACRSEAQASSTVSGSNVSDVSGVKPRSAPATRASPIFAARKMHCAFIAKTFQHGASVGVRLGRRRVFAVRKNTQERALAAL